MGGNQVRVLDPDRDDRLRTVSEAIARSGVQTYADILAEGFIARLHRRVWSVLNDDVGTQDDVERLVGWNGPPRTLADALLRAGHVVDVRGVLVCVSAVTHAPEFVRARWKRADPAGYQEAMRRAVPPSLAAGITVEAPRAEEEVDETRADMEAQGWLFGDPPRAEEDQHGKKPGVKQFVDRWHRAWSEKYRGRYPWRRADFRFIDWIIAATGDIECAWDAAKRYLSNGDRYYAGHEIRRLYTDLARFASANPSGSSKARTPTERDEEVRRTIAVREQRQRERDDNNADIAKRVDALRALPEAELRRLWKKVADLQHDRGLYGKITTGDPFAGRTLTFLIYAAMIAEQQHGGEDAPTSTD